MMPEPLQLVFFGGLRVLRGDIPIAGFTSTKPQALLCYLALTGRPHFRDSLLALLWSDLPEDAARNNLRSTLSNLRKVVGDHIRITAQTVSFNVDAPYSIDVQQFQRALADTRNAERLQEAVDMLRGEFLEGFRVRNAPEFEDWVTAERERLRQPMLHAFEMLAATYLERGDVPRSLDTMLRTLRIDPWRESVHRQLMETYALHGQRDTALRQFQQCRRVLEMELGVEPADETIQLAEQIEQGTFLMLRPPQAAPARSLPTRTYPALPLPPAPIVGRDALLSELVEILAARLPGQGWPPYRLVTLLGPAGVGKTRLALEAAHQMRDAFEGNVYYVSLATICDSTLIAPMVAMALDDSFTADRPVLDTVREHLADKRSLIVLDNFEQVLAAAPFVGQMLSSIPELRVLVTSQAPLRIQGEQELAVPPLSLPPVDLLPGHGMLSGPASVVRELGQYAAVALFAERARQIDLRFALTEENAPFVARICRQLDGLPLAIELAAARTKLLPLPVLAARLDHRLAVLTSGLRDAAARHHTLRAALQWSYDLLTKHDQALLAQLSVFVHGFTLDAAEQVCDLTMAGMTGANTSILDGLAALLDRSLLRQADATELSASSAYHEPRFMMLETIREFALEQLSMSGTEDLLRERHARYYLRLAEAAQADIASPEEVAGLRRLAVEHDNVRSVLAWTSKGTSGKAAYVALGLRMTAALGRFWLIRGYHQEGQEWLERFLALGHDDDAEVIEARAQALVAGAWIAHARDDFSRASRMFEEAAHVLGDDNPLLDMLVNAAMEARAEGQYARATHLLEEALERCEALGNQSAIGRGGLGLTLARLALVLGEQGAYEAARARWNECLTLHRCLDDGRGIAVALLGLGDVARYEAKTDLVYRYCEESRQLFEELGDRANVAFALNNLALAAAFDGNLRAATDYAAECVELLGGFKTGSALAEGLATQGYIHILLNEFAAAQTALTHSLGEALKNGPRWLVAVDLENMAELLSRQAPSSLADDSVRLLGLAQALRTAIGAPLPPIRRPSIAHLEGALREMLGTRYEESLAEGAALSPESVVEQLLVQMTT